MVGCGLDVALAAGEVLAVFPEGTTGDGTALLPFHGNLLQAAIDAAAAVQPVALRYLDSASGAPSFAARYVEADTLLQSFWRTVCAAAPVTARLDYGAPQPAAGTPTMTACGRLKLPHVAGGTTPHVLNCLRLALHQEWIGDERWRIMRRLDGGGAGDEPIPDFARFPQGQLLAVEVEGTLHRAHINEKHRRYARLARRLGADCDIFLSIALTFSDDRDYATVAGFALSVLKRLPETGERFRHDGWRFEIVDMDGRKIDKLIAAEEQG